MPKVSIREIDSTGSETLQYLNYTVLIPGPKLGYYTEDPKDPTKKIFVEFKPKITDVYTSTKDLPKGLEPIDDDGEPVFAEGKYDYKKDLGHLMIVELLSKGLSVHYAPAYTLSDDYYVSPVARTRQEIIDFFEPFTDKGKIDLRFITTGGLSKVDSHYTEFAEAALKCAGKRGDAVALLDVPEKDLNTSDLIDTWVQDNLKTVAESVIDSAYRDGVSWSQTEKAVETYGRYGAIFAPWLNVKFGKDWLTIPGSFNYLAAFAKYIQRYKSWFAISGSIRGVSPYSSIVPTVEFGDADINVFQVRTGDADDTWANGHIATDVICNIRPYGNIIWGNRTMHPLSKPNNDTGDAAIQLTASSFLNIRQLCIDIKKTLYRAARRFTFEPNSDVLWINFKGAITPLLEEMKANQGIKGYQVIQLTTNKKALLVAKIKIVPIEAVEDFDLTVELSDSIGVTEE